MQIQVLPALKDNYCYLLRDGAVGVTAVVDPSEPGPVLEALKAHKAKLSWILLTHHHPDHVGGVDELVKRTGCRVAGAESDRYRLPALDHGLQGGDRFSLGAFEARIFSTPGHTLGALCWWFPTASAVFTGDTLFSLGCGRLFEGTPEQMWGSLLRLRGLPPDTRVYCGHEYTVANGSFAAELDPQNAALAGQLERAREARAAGLPTIPSTIGDERAANPFLRADDPALTQRLGLSGKAPHEVFAEIRRLKDQWKPPVP